MNKKEAKEFVFGLLESSFIKELGYNQITKGIGDVGFRFQRAFNDGLEFITINLDSRGTYHKLWYSYSIELNLVRNILNELHKIAPIHLYKPKDVLNSTVGFNENSINGVHGSPYSLPSVETKEELKENVNKIINFTKNIAFDEFDKIKSIKFLDTFFNEDPLNVSIFGLKYRISNFELTRIIIARLANNPCLDEIIQKTYDGIDKEFIDGGYPDRVNRVDLNTPLPRLVSMIYDIEPIY